MVDENKNKIQRGFFFLFTVTFHIRICEQKHSQGWWEWERFWCAENWKVVSVALYIYINIKTIDTNGLYTSKKIHIDRWPFCWFTFLDTNANMIWLLNSSHQPSSSLFPCTLVMLRKAREEEKKKQQEFPLIEWNQIVIITKLSEQ